MSAANIPSSDFTAFAGAALWDAFEALGMLHAVRVKQAVVRIGMSQTDVLHFGTSLSRDVEIEYRTMDLPKLAQDDPVTFLDADLNPISKAKFTVREIPNDVEQRARYADGYFRYAKLTAL